MEWTTSGNNRIIQLLGGRSNVFVVRHHGGGILMIDSSVKIARRFLVWAMEKNKIEKVDYLILTHCHFDHAANACFIREKTGAGVVIHKDEAEYLTKGGMELPDGTNPVTDKLVNFARKINFTITSEPCPVDLEIDDNLVLPGFDGIEIIHTPGHSKGSVSILIDREIALVGDTMVNVAMFKIFPPFAENTTLLKESWQKLLNTKCTLFLPSHGSAANRNELQGALWELERRLNAK